jgi:hypothetical protein
LPYPFATEKLCNDPGNTMVGVSLKWGWMVTGSVEVKRAYTMLDRITEHCNQTVTLDLTWEFWSFGLLEVGV